MGETLEPFRFVFTRRKNRSPSSATEDPVFLRPELRRDEVGNHRSCYLHLLCKLYGKNPTRKQLEQIEDEYGTAICAYTSISRRLRSRKGGRYDRLLSQNVSSDPISFQGTETSPCLDQLQETCTSAGPDSGPLQATGMSFAPCLFHAENMSTGSFSEHLESLWKTFHADKLVNFTYLDCLWFGLYRKEDMRSRVLSWVKKKNIFSRKYVFVPICVWHHWYLLILCNFNEGLDSGNKRPFMLLLDSLHMADPMRLKKDINAFVFHICKEEGILDQMVSEIPLHVPKVPQQKNKECGFFTLYFIKKFVEDAPETILDCNVPFINQNWFGREDFDGFCFALVKDQKERSELKAKTSKESVHESDSEGDVVVIND